MTSNSTQKSFLDDKETNKDVFSNFVNCLLTQAAKSMVANKRKQKRQNFRAVKKFQNKFRAEISNLKGLTEAPFDYSLLESKIKEQELLIEMLQEKNHFLKNNEVDLSQENNSNSE